MQIECSDQFLVIGAEKIIVYDLNNRKHYLIEEEDSSLVNQSHLYSNRLILHTVTFNDMDRLEHFIWCWELATQKTVFKTI